MAGPWEKYKAAPAAGPWERYKTPSTEPEGEKPGYLETAVRGAVQGATGGFADEIGGGIGALVDKVTGSEESLGDLYRQRRDTLREGDAAAAAENPLTSLISNVAGGVALPVGGVLKGASAAQRIAGATALGAGYGFGGSDSDLTQGEFGEAVTDTITGAAGGAVLSGGLEAARKLVQGLRPAANRMAVRAAGSKTGDLKRMAANGRPGSEAVGEALLEEGTIKPFATTEQTLERIQAAKQGRGQEIERVLKGNPVTVDPTRIGDRIAMEVVDPLAGSAPNKGRFEKMFGELTDFDNYHGDKALSLEDAEQLKRQYQGNIGYNAELPALGQDKAKIPRIIAEEVENRLNQVNAPAGGEFQQAKSAYGKLALAEDSAFNGVQREQARLPIGVADMAAGLMAGGGLKGAATAVGSKLVRSRGASTAAWTLDRLSKLASSPQAGRFGGFLRQAAARGNASLAATHFVLSQSSPEYRKHLESLNQEPGNED